MSHVLAERLTGQLGQQEVASPADVELTALCKGLRFGAASACFLVVGREPRKAGHLEASRRTSASSPVKSLRLGAPHSRQPPVMGTALETIFNSKGMRTPVFTQRYLQQPTCPSGDKWIKKLCCIYLMEYYSASKRTKSYHLRQRGWTQTVLCSVK